MSAWVGTQNHMGKGTRFCVYTVYAKGGNSSTPLLNSMLWLCKTHSKQHISTVRTAAVMMLTAELAHYSHYVRRPLLYSASSANIHMHNKLVSLKIINEKHSTSLTLYIYSKRIRFVEMCLCVFTFYSLKFYEPNRLLLRWLSTLYTFNMRNTFIYCCISPWRWRL